MQWGALRLKLGRDLGLTELDQWAPLWVIDFPMFELDDEVNLAAMHHPFTSPRDFTPEQLEARGRQRRLPMRMIWLLMVMKLAAVRCGFSIENATNRVPHLGINEREQREKFGFLLDALKFGTPPHARLAFGLDRLTMLLTGTKYS